VKRVSGAISLLLVLAISLALAETQRDTRFELRDERADTEIILWKNVEIQSAARYSLGSQEAWESLRWSFPQVVNLDGLQGMDLVRIGKRIEHLEFSRKSHLGVEVYLNKGPGSYKRVCRIYKSGMQLDLEIKDIDGDGVLEIEIDEIQCGDICQERLSILKYSKAKKTIWDHVFGGSRRTHGVHDGGSRWR